MQDHRLKLDPLTPRPQLPTPLSELTLRFISALRTAGLRISIAESMDAMDAVGAVGLEQEFLREALAACLVKEEDERVTFDEVFARFFVGPKGRHKGKLHTSAGDGGQQSKKTQGNLGRPQEPPLQQSRTAKSQTSKQSEQQSHNNKDREAKNKEATPTSDLRPPTPLPQPLSSDPQFSGSRLPTPKSKMLLEKPFRLFDARDVEETKELVEALARQLRGRLSRRYKPRKRGRLD